MTDSYREHPDGVHVQPEPLPPMGTGPSTPNARGIADRGREGLAHAFDFIGERIEDRGRTMRRRGGSRGRAGRAAVAAGHALEAGADYLRDHEVDAMQRELEGRVRERPLASLAIALAAGFVLARLLRH
jgi:hypothetical protein